MIVPALRYLSALLVLLPLLVSGVEARPNVVVFVVDDLGQRDVGVYGSSFYETPNVDRLARDGARFKNGYSTCPVCSPSRSSLLTGRYPVRTQVTDYIGAASTPEAWKRNTLLLPAPYVERLALEEKTLAELLKAEGYATMFAGKWHLGPEGFYPENQGFDVNKGGIDRGGPYGGKGYFSPYGNPRLSDGPPGEHLPDRLATEVCQFIDGHKDQPFLAYFAFYSVHTPLMARPDLQKKYEEKRRQLGLQPKFGKEEPREVRLVQEHAVYAAMVEAMDQAVGKVLAHLEALKLADNTIVVFTSDNGGLSTSEGSPTSNLPLRAGKGWLYEGGIRVPWIVRWPGKIKPGLELDVPICSADLMPTISEAAKIQLPAVDGRSFLPAMTEGKALERPIFWHYPHYGNQGGAPGSAVRLGPWKLIRWYEGDRQELYNLDTDIGEAHDLSQSEPQKVAELTALLDSWLKETHALLPTKNPSYTDTQLNGRSAPAPKAKKGKGRAVESAKR